MKSGTLDDYVRCYLEQDLGFLPRSFPGAGVVLHEPPGRNDEYLVEIAVDTEAEYRGQGFGLDVVTAAVEWIILSCRAVANYPVMPDNILSVRIAKRLGFQVAWHKIYA